MIPAYIKLQINLQHRFYIKGSNTNDRVQKHNGRLKTEFEIQYDNHDDDTRRTPHPAHRYDANLPDLHGEDGATRRSNPEEVAVQSRTHRSPRISGDTTYSEGLQQQP